MHFRNVTELEGQLTAAKCSEVVRKVDIIITIQVKYRYSTY